MNQVTMKDLLSAGVHFGHQTSKWNPKMKPFIFGARNGIYIVDLQKTVKLVQRAVDFVRQQVSEGKNILFVGTKTQAKDVIREEAERCGANYITFRWLGGLLTNFKTIRSGIERWEEIETMKSKGIFEVLTKKEVAKLEKERKKLEMTFAGIKNMKEMPGVIFVVDPNHEEIAVAEARKLGITLVGVVDTNCDPDPIDYVIPGNDDAIKSIKLFSSIIADAVAEGRTLFEEKIRAEGGDVNQVNQARQEAAERALNQDDRHHGGRKPAKEKEVKEEVVVEKIRKIERRNEEAN